MLKAYKACHRRNGSAECINVECGPETGRFNGCKRKKKVWGVGEEEQKKKKEGKVKEIKTSKKKKGVCIITSKVKY